MNENVFIRLAFSRFFAYNGFVSEKHEHFGKNMNNLRWPS